MNSDYFSIQLNIGTRTFSIQIERKKEQTYREAAKMINDKLRQYASHFPDQEKEDYLAMATLDIAVNLISEQNIDERLKDMIKTIDKSISH